MSTKNHTQTTQTTPQSSSTPKNQLSITPPVILSRRRRICVVQRQNLQYSTPPLTCHLPPHRNSSKLQSQIYALGTCARERRYPVPHPPSKLDTPGPPVAEPDEPGQISPNTNSVEWALAHAVQPSFHQIDVAYPPHFPSLDISLYLTYYPLAALMPLKRSETIWR